MKYYITEHKKKYSGNVHCHSTRSDGKSKVSELVEGYKGKGYNFLVISDHRRVFNHNNYNTENFIVMSGMEIDTWIEPNPNHKFFHFQVIGDLPHDYYEETKIFDNYIDSMSTYKNYSKYLQIVNHPYWSRMEMSDLIYLRPKIIEIYNHSAEALDGVGVNLNTWDELLFLGHKVLGIAADDNHMSINGDDQVKDFYGGLIVVESLMLTSEKIIENIEKGNFYSKMGVNAPDFIELVLDGDTVKVKTTNVDRIKFIAYNYHGKVVHKEKGKDLNYAEFKSSGHKFVRIELEDKNNLKSWSNPIYF